MRRLTTFLVLLALGLASPALTAECKGDGWRIETRMLVPLSDFDPINWTKRQTRAAENRGLLLHKHGLRNLGDYVVAFLYLDEGAEVSLSEITFVYPTYEVATLEILRPVDATERVVYSTSWTGIKVKHGDAPSTTTGAFMVMLRFPAASLPRPDWRPIRLKVN